VPGRYYCAHPAENAKNVGSLKIHARGVRREEHPTGFSKVTLEIALTSSNADPADVARAIQLAESKFCPVVAMIKGNAELEITQTISQV
jgi:putative redox protein